MGYEIKFISNHEFGDKRIDSNIEFKRAGLDNIHAWTNICPCGSDPTKEDPCLTSEAPLKKYPSKQCRSKRRARSSPARLSAKVAPKLRQTPSPAATENPTTNRPESGTSERTTSDPAKYCIYC